MVSYITYKKNEETDNRQYVLALDRIFLIYELFELKQLIYQKYSHSLENDFHNFNYTFNL